MKTLAKISIVVLAVAVVTTIHTRAACAVTLSIPASLDGTVSHSFDNISGFVRDNLDLTASSFSTDLGSLSDMKVDLSVSPGQKIKVDLPAGKTGFIEVLLNYQGTLGVFNTDEPWSNAVQLLGVSGPAPALSSTDIRGRLNGNQVNIQAVYQFTAPFSFTGWKADVTGPFSSGGTMTYSDAGSFFQIRYSDTVDGGQFVTIVPEPSTLVLAAIGLFAHLLLRRRRT